MTDRKAETELMKAAEVGAAVERLAGEINTAFPDGTLHFVGIITRGDTLARRVGALLAARGRRVDFGSLDIALYRDDLNLRNFPAIRGSEVPFEIEGRDIVLFDDVLYTGRTIRAAIEELLDYGRPSRIALAVLVDRNGRELPIASDFHGARVQTGPDEHVRVRLAEHDGEDSVFQINRTHTT
ncbi:MAG: bifunctional pyr operon transcriptional regulator/uracil phosphoribosyltransferase PyrR [Kiritimatiellia bacterium]